MVRPRPPTSPSTRMRRPPTPSRPTGARRATTAGLREGGTPRFATGSVKAAAAGPHRSSSAASAGALHPALVPDRPLGLVDRAVRAVDQEPVEATREPAVVGDRDHRALERLEP